MQTIPHTQPKTTRPQPAVRRAPKPETRITAMAGMTRDEVRRLVLALIG